MNCFSETAFTTNEERPLNESTDDNKPKVKPAIPDDDTSVSVKLRSASDTILREKVESLTNVRFWRSETDVSVDFSNYDYGLATGGGGTCDQEDNCTPVEPAANSCPPKTRLKNADRVSMRSSVNVSTSSSASYAEGEEGDYTDDRDVESTDLVPIKNDSQCPAVPESGNRRSSRVLIDSGHQRCYRVTLARRHHQYHRPKDDDDDDYDQFEDESEAKQSSNGRYIRLEEIGRGAFKTVYKGLDSKDGIAVAWCELQDVYNKSERSRFREEIRVLKELHHQNIVRFFDYWLYKTSTRRIIVLVTELMTSGSLKTYSKNFKNELNPKKVRIIRNWCRQILQGLSYMHTRDPPIIHRDLKCDNIFITGTTGTVKIGDLGLAIFKTNTFAKSMRGTVEFMAPEMFKEMYDEMVDVYSFGLCVVELATGEYPYTECKFPSAVMRKVMNGIKPNCFFKIRNDSMREMINCCIRRRKSERLSAERLLKHSFFLETDGVSVSVTSPQGAASIGCLGSSLASTLMSPQNAESPDTTVSRARRLERLSMLYSMPETIEFTVKFQPEHRKLAEKQDEEDFKFEFNTKHDTQLSVVEDLVEKHLISSTDSEYVAQCIEDRLREIHFHCIYPMPRTIKDKSHPSICNEISSSFSQDGNLCSDEFTNADFSSIGNTVDDDDDYLHCSKHVTSADSIEEINDPICNDDDSIAVRETIDQILNEVDDVYRIASQNAKQFDEERSMEHIGMVTHQTVSTNLVVNMISSGTSTAKLTEVPAVIQNSSVSVFEQCECPSIPSTDPKTMTKPGILKKSSVQLQRSSLDLVTNIPPIDVNQSYGVESNLCDSTFPSLDKIEMDSIDDDMDQSQQQTINDQCVPLDQQNSHPPQERSEFRTGRFNVVSVDQGHSLPSPPCPSTDALSATHEATATDNLPLTQNTSDQVVSDVKIGSLSDSTIANSESQQRRDSNLNEFNQETGSTSMDDHPFSGSLLRILRVENDHLMRCRLEIQDLFIEFNLHYDPFDIDVLAVILNSLLVKHWPLGLANQHKDALVISCISCLQNIIKDLSSYLILIKKTQDDEDVAAANQILEAIYQRVYYLPSNLCSAGIQIIPTLFQRPQQIDNGVECDLSNQVKTCDATSYCMSEGSKLELSVNKKVEPVATSEEKQIKVGKQIHATVRKVQSKAAKKFEKNLKVFDENLRKVLMEQIEPVQDIVCLTQTAVEELNARSDLQGDPTTLAAQKAMSIVIIEQSNCSTGNADTLRITDKREEISYEQNIASTLESTNLQCQHLARSPVPRLDDDQQSCTYSVKTPQTTIASNEMAHLLQTVSEDNVNCPDLRTNDCPSLTARVEQSISVPSDIKEPPNASTNSQINAEKISSNVQSLNVNIQTASSRGTDEDAQVTFDGPLPPTDFQESLRVDCAKVQNDDKIDFSESKSSESQHVKTPQNRPHPTEVKAEYLNSEIVDHTWIHDKCATNSPGMPTSSYMSPSKEVTRTDSIKNPADHLINPIECSTKTSIQENGDGFSMHEYVAGQNGSIGSHINTINMTTDSPLLHGQSLKISYVQAAVQTGCIQKSNERIAARNIGSHIPTEAQSSKQAQGSENEVLRSNRRFVSTETQTQIVHIDCTDQFAECTEKKHTPIELRTTNQAQITTSKTSVPVDISLYDCNDLPTETHVQYNSLPQLTNSSAEASEIHPRTNRLPIESILSIGKIHQKQHKMETMHSGGNAESIDDDINKLKNKVNTRRLEVVGNQSPLSGIHSIDSAKKFETNIVISNNEFVPDVSRPSSIMVPITKDFTKGHVSRNSLADMVDNVTEDRSNSQCIPIDIQVAEYSPERLRDDARSSPFSSQMNRISTVSDSSCNCLGTRPPSVSELSNVQFKSTGSERVSGSRDTHCKDRKEPLLRNDGVQAVSFEKDDFNAFPILIKPQPRVIDSSNNRLQYIKDESDCFNGRSRSVQTQCPDLTETLPLNIIRISQYGSQVASEPEQHFVVSSIEHVSNIRDAPCITHNTQDLNFEPTFAKYRASWVSNAPDSNFPVEAPVDPATYDLEDPRLEREEINLNTHPCSLANQESPIVQLSTEIDGISCSNQSSHWTETHLRPLESQGIQLPVVYLKDETKNTEATKFSDQDVLRASFLNQSIKNDIIAHHQASRPCCFHATHHSEKDHNVRQEKHPLGIQSIHMNNGMSNDSRELESLPPIISSESADYIGKLGHGLERNMNVVGQTGVGDQYIMSERGIAQKFGTITHSDRDSHCVRRQAQTLKVPSITLQHCMAQQIPFNYGRSNERGSESCAQSEHELPPISSLTFNDRVNKPFLSTNPLSTAVIYSYSGCSSEVNTCSHNHILPNYIRRLPCLSTGRENSAFHSVGHRIGSNLTTPNLNPTGPFDCQACQNYSDQPILDDSENEVGMCSEKKMKFTLSKSQQSVPCATQYLNTRNTHQNRSLESCPCVLDKNEFSRNPFVVPTGEKSDFQLVFHNTYPFDKDLIPGKNNEPVARFSTLKRCPSNNREDCFEEKQYSKNDSESRAASIQFIGTEKQISDQLTRDKPLVNVDGTFEKYVAPKCSMSRSNCNVSACSVCQHFGHQDTGCSKHGGHLAFIPVFIPFTETGSNSNVILTEWPELRSVYLPTDQVRDRLAGSSEEIKAESDLKVHLLTHKLRHRDEKLGSNNVNTQFVCRCKGNEEDRCARSVPRTIHLVDNEIILDEDTSRAIDHPLIRPMNPDAAADEQLYSQISTKRDTASKINGSTCANKYVDKGTSPYEYTSNGTPLDVADNLNPNSNDMENFTSSFEPTESHKLTSSSLMNTLIPKNEDALQLVNRKISEPQSTELLHWDAEANSVNDKAVGTSDELPVQQKAQLTHVPPKQIATDCQFTQTDLEWTPVQSQQDGNCSLGRQRKFVNVPPHIDANEQPERPSGRFVQTDDYLSESSEHGLLKRQIELTRQLPILSTDEFSRRNSEDVHLMMAPTLRCSACRSTNCDDHFTDQHSIDNAVIPFVSTSIENVTGA
ncbi:hypothetical protein ACOME3_010107 [Neoechinorhynchus agilis]